MTYTGGYPIPYNLNADEKLDFLERNAGNEKLQTYLASPCWSDTLGDSGITIQEAYGTLMVWRDFNYCATGDVADLYVVDITNLQYQEPDGTMRTLSASIDAAPYESPDSSFLLNLYKAIQDLIKGLKPTINYALLAAIVIGGYFLMSEFNRARV